jgi:hypothetical protein
MKRVGILSVKSLAFSFKKVQGLHRKSQDSAEAVQQTVKTSETEKRKGSLPHAVATWVVLALQSF